MKIFTLEKESRLKTRNYTFELQKRKNNTSTKTQKLRSTSLKLQSIFISFFAASSWLWQRQERSLRGGGGKKLCLMLFYDFVPFYSKANSSTAQQIFMHDGNIYGGSLCGGISRTLSNTLWITCISLLEKPFSFKCTHKQIWASRTRRRAIMRSCLKMQSKLMKTYKSQMNLALFCSPTKHTIYH